MEIRRHSPTHKNRRGQYAAWWRSDKAAHGKEPLCSVTVVCWLTAQPPGTALAVIAAFRALFSNTPHARPPPEASITG